MRWMAPTHRHGYVAYWKISAFKNARSRPVMAMKRHSGHVRGRSALPPASDIPSAMSAYHLIASASPPGLDVASIPGERLRLTQSGLEFFGRVFRYCSNSASSTKTVSPLASPLSEGSASSPTASMPRMQGNWTFGECPCLVNSSDRLRLLIPQPTRDAVNKLVHGRTGTQFDSRHRRWAGLVPLTRLAP